MVGREEEIFRPVELLMTVGDDSEKRKEYPGTPKRDMTDFGELILDEE